MVVAQQPTKSLTTLDRPITVRGARRRGDEPIPKPLVIPVGVVVPHVLADQMPQVPLPYGDHTVEALASYREHPSFREGVQIRASCRQPYALGPLAGQHVAGGMTCPEE